MNKYVTMTQPLLTVILLIWLALVLSSCDLGNNPIVDEVRNIASTSEAIVSSTVFESAIQSPLPTPTVAPLKVPTPAKGKGTVTGTLVWVMPNSMRYKGSTSLLYLGSVLRNESGQAAFVALDKGEDPQTLTDPEGRFVFKDIEPGTYGLVYSLAPNASQDYLLNILDNEGDFLITVEPNQVTNIDQFITAYPLPSPSN